VARNSMRVDGAKRYTVKKGAKSIIHVTRNRLLKRNREKQNQKRDDLYGSEENEKTYYYLIR
jgi:hypothetical protein